jgi:hypothetical protein
MSPPPAVGVTRDGYAKIFIKPLSRKALAKAAAAGIAYRAASATLRSHARRRAHILNEVADAAALLRGLGNDARVRRGAEVGLEGGLLELLLDALVPDLVQLGLGAPLQRLDALRQRLVHRRQLARLLADVRHKGQTRQLSRDLLVLRAQQEALLAPRALVQPPHQRLPTIRYKRAL